MFQPWTSVPLRKLLLCSSGTFRFRHLAPATQFSYPSLLPFIFHLLRYAINDANIKTANTVPTAAVMYNAISELDVSGVSGTSGSLEQNVLDFVVDVRCSVFGRRQGGGIGAITVMRTVSVIVTMPAILPRFTKEKRCEKRCKVVSKDAVRTLTTWSYQTETMKLIIAHNTLLWMLSMLLHRAEPWMFLRSPRGADTVEQARLRSRSHFLILFHIRQACRLVGTALLAGERA
ncbi:hypothetical protein BKA58DRAFT_446382 [Alternaria rosae]|uniref:uncharacterized protein n=1 Tax=Alternaria rosae TaxID=1187941 RepID=UPI001E8DB8F4|nr:uncharacterized protein BKA58DRAFT_446382 [Alternaria rosae]KAH6882045.1 hypothetical protein BKA58DRAFT_446382 [Alternaria rosae]